MSNDAPIFPIKKVLLQAGLEIAYSDSEKGKTTLMFVHGLASNQKGWQKNIPELSRDFRCISLDLPGYGLSSSGPFPKSMEFLAQAVALFAMKMELKKVILVGHSMGGQIAMTLSIKKFFPIEGLVLLAPAGFELFTSSEKEWLTRFFSPEILFHLPDFQMVRNFESNFYRMPEDARFMIEDRRKLSRDSQRFRQYCETVSGNLMAMLNEPVHSRLNLIRVPTFILFGEEDKLIPNRLLHGRSSTRKIGEAGHKALPNSKLMFLPKCGHFLQWECSSLVNYWLKDFLEKLGTGD
jgi:pimeloyl-ACP methyl ester carboxylesterase